MKLHPDLEKPEVLAFIAAMLAWREGDDPPQAPIQLTMPVPELLRLLNDETIRREVVLRLSPLVPHPNRRLRRRKTRRT